MNDNTTMLNRRNFLFAGSSFAVARACGAAQTLSPAPAASVEAKRLLATAPALQNPADTSVAVVFGVNALASGWVEVSEHPDMRDAVRHYSGGHGMMAIDEEVAQIQIRGLKPATRYWYRIGADRIDFAHGYAMRNLGSERDEAVYSFQTLGAAASGRFCVISDTHENRPALAAVYKRIAELSPAVVVWNGDATNVTETEKHAIEIFLRPHPDYPTYSSSVPYLFVPGNHDYRGRFARTLERVVMFRDASERAGEFAELGRNFVQRLGDIALIGLDTGEDKLDTNPAFAGIFRMREYRELQARWLEQVIETPAVKTARFKVVCCHIPLFDPAPDANPGDIQPADSDPRYRTDFAEWQRTCAGLWGPSFVRAGVQLVIAAHQHRYRYDAPSASRPWAQMVGAGLGMVIDGCVEDGRLVVRAHDAAGRIVETLRF